MGTRYKYNQLIQNEAFKLNNQVWHKRIYFFSKAIRRRRKGEGILEKSPYKDILKK